jgi:hypothetical protein
MSYLETLRRAMKEISATGGASEKGPERSLVENEINEINEIRGNGPQIPALKPSRNASLFDLQFPLGYQGLPRAQVEMAKTIQDKLGITEPLLRKYNVLAWIRTHLQYLSLNHGPLYEALVAEQRRLRVILDEDRP